VKIDYKWTALGLLWVACFLQQGMRQIFPPLAGAIGDAFDASGAVRGVVMTVFTFVYALAVPLSGAAGDFLSRKKIVVFSLAVFSTGVFFAGWAWSLPALVVFYGAVNGFGQSFFYPAATSLVQQLHAERKATALSVLQLALYGGIILFSFASGKMLDVCGSWRVPFGVFGAAGVLWAGALVFLLRDTPPPAVAGTSARPCLKDAARAVFSKPSAILLAAALGFQLFADVGFKMWMPTFLHERFPDLTAAQCGLHAVLWHYLGAIAGVMLGSRFADAHVKARPGVRMEMNMLGLVVGAPFIVWMARADAFTAVCAASALFGFSRGIYDSNQFAAIFDVIAPRYRASAMGVMLCCAFLFSSLAPVVLGWIKDTLSLGTGLAALAGFFLAGAAVVAVARFRFLKRDYVG